MTVRPSGTGLITAALAIVSLALATFAFVCSVISLSHASTRPTPAPAQAVMTNAHYEAAIIALRTQPKKQQTDFEAQRHKFEALIDSGLLSGRHVVAMLDPASKNFDRVETGSGFLLVACSAVHPYADGCKVVLDISNPLSVPLNGFRIAARWGARFTGPAKDADAFGKWSATLRAKDFTFTQTLEPGRWNQAEMILGETSPEQLGHIEVAVVADIVGVVQPAVQVKEPPKRGNNGRYQIATSEPWNTLILDTESGRMWKLKAGPNHEDIWVHYTDAPR